MTANPLSASADIDLVSSASSVDGAETVLVVEDEALVRLLVIQTLEDAGYAVLEAAEARSALEMLRQNPSVRLVVTDVGLPGLNGRQLAEQARAVRPDLKILFMTGYADNAVFGGKAMPGTDLIAKPFALEALAAKVDAMLVRQ